MKTILFHCTPAETNQLPQLRPLLSGKANVLLSNQPPTMAIEVALSAKAKGCTSVISTDEKLLHLLLDGARDVSLNNYAGSIINRYGVEFLFLNPIDHLHSVPYGKFLYERYISKILQPADWMQIPEFKWNLFHPADSQELQDLFRTASFIATDIETVDDPRACITCISFAAVHFSPSHDSYSITTIVVPFTEPFNITFAKIILDLPVAKVFQNGKYDNAYLLRYGISTRNWCFDTAHMFHSWYSELPKRLDFITSFVLRDIEYWKDEADCPIGSEKYYAYNAKDSFVTALSWISLLREIPSYAWDNYLAEFPLVFPCLLAEMRGIKIDPLMQEKLAKQVNETMDKELQAVRTMVGSPAYNPSSPPQTHRIFDLLGSEDIKGTGKISMDKAMSRHPLNKRVLTKVSRYRAERKLLSSYVGKEITWNGRVYYSLNPHGTDTGRLASKESAFWCGLQIQNIPRDTKNIKIKSMFIADRGFHFGECDYRQNETWGTAHLSGDAALLRAIQDSSKDFHGLNASSFFGIPYESIVTTTYDAALAEYIHEVVDKVIRDLSKRTNHGANYNMGAGVMLDTMGIENVLRARQLLKLPAHWSLKMVCQYLLDQFDKTYPVVRGDYYTAIKAAVAGTRMLRGPTGWTRYCFSNPTKDKRAMNAYAAHGAQSLGAMQLNKAYIKVFQNVWLPNQQNFKMGPQIHDSILFQYRIGYEHLAFAAQTAMEIPLEVRDIFGFTRAMLVPSDLKGGADRWSELETLRQSIRAKAIG